jgi:hypothetical protein
VYVLPATDSQHAPKLKDRVIHFRKLAALVRKVKLPGMQTSQIISPVVYAGYVEEFMEQSTCCGCRWTGSA